MILTCKRCLRQFDYSVENGYSKNPPICSVSCDFGMIIDAKNSELASVREEFQRLKRIHDRLVSACKAGFESSHTLECPWLKNHSIKCVCGSDERINERMIEIKNAMMVGDISKTL